MAEIFSEIISFMNSAMVLVGHGFDAVLHWMGEALKFMVALWILPDLIMARCLGISPTKWVIGRYAFQRGHRFMRRVERGVGTGRH